MNCSSGCPTQDHATFGECIRSKGLKIAYANSANGHDLTKQKKWDSNLDHYRRLTSQGIQPDNTWPSACEKAEKISQETGQPYVSGA